MTSVTISLEEATARAVRAEAAQCDQSVAGFIADVLRRALEGSSHDAPDRRYSREYEKAMREDLAETPYLDSDPSRPYPTRKELYDRKLQRIAQERASERGTRGPSA